MFFTVKKYTLSHWAYFYFVYLVSQVKHMPMSRDLPISFLIYYFFVMLFLPYRSIIPRTSSFYIKFSYSHQIRPLLFTTFIYCLYANIFVLHPPSLLNNGRRLDLNSAELNYLLPLLPACQRRHGMRLIEPTNQRSASCPFYFNACRRKKWLNSSLIYHRYIADKKN